MEEYERVEQAKKEFCNEFVRSKLIRKMREGNAVLQDGYRKHLFTKNRGKWNELLKQYGEVAFQLYNHMDPKSATVTFPPYVVINRYRSGYTPENIEFFEDDCVIADFVAFLDAIEE